MMSANGHRPNPIAEHEKGLSDSPFGITDNAANATKPEE